MMREPIERWKRNVLEQWATVQFIKMELWRYFIYDGAGDLLATSGHYNLHRRN